MTCIVGVMSKGRVILGGDATASDDRFGKDIRLDPKVFKRGPFVIGFCGSFRMGQLMRFKLMVSPQKEEEDYEYMVTVFAESVRQLLKDYGVAEKKDEVEKGGTFLIGYRGKLYVMEDDYQVGMVAERYTAIGCGADIAKGALFAQGERVSVKKRILKALEASSRFSTAVGPPFTVISQ